MAVACQLVKPLCVVFGLEFHDSLGVPVPPAPPTPPAPQPWGLWISIGTAVLILGDHQSPNVKAMSEGIVKRGSDTKHLRPHLSAGSFVPPFPPPICDLGLWPKNIWGGSAKTIWGPFSIKANITSKEDGPAVIMLFAGTNMGPADWVVCSKPVSYPALFAVQSRNSVVAGMTLADIIGCIVLAAIDMLIDFLLDKILDHKFLPKKAKDALKKAKEKGKNAVKEAGTKAAKAAAKKAAKAEAKQIAKDARKDVKTPLEKLSEKVLGKGADKVGGWLSGKAGKGMIGNMCGKAGKAIQSQGVDKAAEAAKNFIKSKVSDLASKPIDHLVESLVKG